MSTEENVKKLKKWKSFDFGPNKNTLDNNLEKSHSQSQETCSPKRIVKDTFKKRHVNFHDNLIPKNTNELAVHVKKIQELEEWFKNNVVNRQQQQGPPVLLISGPSGSGKLTALKVIAASFKFSVSEWVNPLDHSEYIGENQVSRFLEFMIGCKYKSLFDNENKRITVVKEFPNIFVKCPELFVEVLEDLYYKTNNATVFICTDSGTGNLNLVRTLFKDEILDQYKISHVRFNPCASTLLKSALKRAQGITKQNPNLYSQPSVTTIEAIIATSMGDIRNAINQFYIASLIDSADLPTTLIQPNQTGTKRKRKGQEFKIKDMERDENLGLFHGLGRVLNPKWKDDNFKRLNYDVEKLVNEFSTQPSTFISFLFENYLKYFGDIEDASKAVEMLGLAETFLKNFGEKEELLEYGMWLSILGTMIFNVHKVSRWNEIRGPVKIKKQTVTNRELIGYNSLDIFYCNLIRKTN